MNFEDERYVRVYTRKTVTTKLIGWEGRATLHALLLEVDRAGVLDLEGEGPAEALTALSELPIEITRVGMPRLIERGVVTIRDNQLVLPRFIEAQESRQSDAQRQRESRAKRAALANVSEHAVRAAASAGIDVTNRDHTESQNVTDCHTESHDVTNGHSVLSCAQPYQQSSAEEEHPSGVVARARATKPAKAPRWRRVPRDWEPNEADMAKARALGVNVELELDRYRDHEFERPKSDPDATFRNWLRTALERSRSGGQLRLAPRPGDQARENIDRQLARLAEARAEEARKAAMNQ